MRYLIQRPLPDELLSSVWVRSARRAGLPIGVVTSALTNGRKWAPSFFSASHLSDLAPLLGTTPMDLLWQHTVFPYATAFFEPVTFEKALAAALATGLAATGMGAVTQSVSDQVRFRRYCPVCAREDQKRWGESYWHRAHNLPGVLVCLAHDRVLRETMLQTAGTRSWTGFLPHELVGTRVLRDRPNAFQLELAKRSVATLGRTPVGAIAPQEPLGACPSTHVGGPGVRHLQVGRQPSWYRDALLAQRLLSQNRQVSVQKLVAWAQSAIGGKVTRYGLTEQDATLSWLGLMVRPKISIPFVPLKHLVFEALLALELPASSPQMAVVTEGADAICATGAKTVVKSATVGTVGSRDTAPVRALLKLDHVSTGLRRPPIHLLEQRDKQYAAALAEVIRDYRKRGRRVRVCDALAEAGCWSDYRHNTADFPRVSAVVLQLRMSEASARQIVGETTKPRLPKSNRQ